MTFWKEVSVDCQKTNNDGYSCRIDRSFSLANTALTVVTAVLLLLIAGWLVKGLTQRRGGGPALQVTNMEAFFTISSQEDLARAMAAGHPLLAVVYAPWCGHCKTFLPAFKQAALTLQQRQQVGVTLAIIDGDAFPEIVKHAGIRGYPTCIQMWPDGKVTSQQPSARSPEAVVDLAQRVERAATGEGAGAE